MNLGLRIFTALQPKRDLPVLRWTVNGHPVEVVLYPVTDKPPAPDAQRHPSSGIWVTLRSAESAD